MYQLLLIGYALALAPGSYLGVRAVSKHYKAEIGKNGVLLVSCLQTLLTLTPLIVALCHSNALYSALAIPVTLLIPAWAGRMLYLDYLTYRRSKMDSRLFAETLESIIEDDFESIDTDGDDLLNEQDLVNASINFKDLDPEKSAALEQLLANIAEVGHVTGVIEQSTYSDDVLIATVKRNLYAIRKSDLRKYPAALRSQYQIW